MPRLPDRFTTASPRLRYIGAGEGPIPIVLVHGLSDTLDSYRTVLTSLSRHQQVYALDLRGHGRSARAASYRMDAYVADLQAFIEERVGAPALLAGHSMGALVGLRLAAQRPDLLRGLLLEDPPLYRTTVQAFGETLFFSYFTHLHREICAHRARGESVEDFADRIAAWPYGRGRTMGEVLGRQGVLLRAGQLDQLDECTLEHLLQGRLLEDTTSADLLPQVQCPIHLLAGAVLLGGALFASEIRRFQGQMPSAGSTVLDDVGHNIHHEAPRSYLRAMQDFLRSLAVPTG